MAETTAVLTALTAPVITDIQQIVSAATTVDSVSPLSEAFLLALGPSRPGVIHVARSDAVEGLVGYAQITSDGSAELVVDPAARHSGHGRALLDAVLAQGATGVWSHGRLPAAAALADSAGLVVGRELLKMERTLGPDDLADPVLPQGWTSTTFAGLPDVKALQRVNAAAFAHHREQGRLTVADLRERMAQPWFDPSGLFWLRREDDPPGAEPAAFHWTKIEPDSTTGEVYVVGVHPDAQGRGLAGPLTRLGLQHLAAQGCTAVELYVDGDNAPALATYLRQGFHVVESHVVFVRDGVPGQAST
ncbi:MAG: mycothiol synthase [Phycicoccus sp.]|nr:mycothiol synthase [Phycicoccus sp.]